MNAPKEWETEIEGNTNEMKVVRVWNRKRGREGERDENENTNKNKNKNIERHRPKRRIDQEKI